MTHFRDRSRDAYRFPSPPEPGEWWVWAGLAALVLAGLVEAA